MVEDRWFMCFSWSRISCMVLLRWDLRLVWALFVSAMRCWSALFVSTQLCCIFLCSVFRMSSTLDLSRWDLDLAPKNRNVCSKLPKILYFDIVISQTNVMDLVSRTFQEISFLELFKKFYPCSCLFTLWGLNVVLSKMWPCLRDANGWVNFLDSSVEIYCPYSHNKWCQIDNDTDATLSYCGSSELYYQCW